MLSELMRSRAPYELFRRSESPFWFVNFIDREGRRVRQSTKESDKRRAHVVARELERKLADPTYRTANETTVGEAAVNLAEHLENTGKAEATRDFYDEKLGHVKRILGADTPLSKITAGAVDDFLRLRKREGAARYTISKELTALRMLLKVARRRGEFDREVSQVMPVGYSTGYKPRTRRVTVAEAWALIAELPEGPARYTAFVCATTARDSAVHRALGGDLTEAGIRVRETKTKAGARVVPLTRVTRPFAERAFAGVAAGAQVAPGISSVRHAYARACRRLGLAPLSPNDIRRSVAHWHLEAGVPRDIVAAFMGHTSTKMLDLVYGKLDAGEIGAAMARVLDEPARS